MIMKPHVFVCVCTCHLKSFKSFTLFSQSLQLYFNDVCLLFVLVIAVDIIRVTDVFALAGQFS